MHTRRSVLALVLVLALVGAGCGLFESNDDEFETLRAELVQLREDVLDLETEVSLLAVSPPTTAARVVTTTTRPKASSSSSSSSSSVSVTTTTTKALESSEPSVFVPDEAEVELILTAVYGWGPGSTVEVLQTVLGIGADGWYGNQTRSAHLAVLEARELSTDGVPAPPTTTTEAPAEGEATTEAPAETTTTTEAPAETTTTTTVAG